MCMYICVYRAIRICVEYIEINVYIELHLSRSGVLLPKSKGGGGGYAHRRFIYKWDTSTHAQGTDPRVALGA